MSLLAADPNGSVTLRQIAEGLLQDAFCFGILSIDQGVHDQQLERYHERIKTTYAVLWQLEQHAGLRFDDDAIPFYRDMPLWGEGVPFAGWTRGAAGPKPSEVLFSLQAGWRVFQKTRSNLRGLLGAALWVTWHEGMEAALKLAIDLLTHGWVLDSESLTMVISTLIRSRSQLTSDRETVVRLLGGREPRSYEDFFKIPPDLAWQAPDYEVSKIVPLLATLVDIARNEIEGVREAADLADWLVGQMRLNGLVGPIRTLLTRCSRELPLTVHVVESQLEEIEADAAALSFEWKSGTDLNYLSLLRNALGPILEIRKVAPRDWRERLLDERVVVPNALADIALDLIGPWPASWTWAKDLGVINSFFTLNASGHLAHLANEEGWQFLQLSSTWPLAHAYVVALRPESRDPKYVRTMPYEAQEIASHERITSFFARFGPSDPKQQLAHLERLATQRMKVWFTERERAMIRQQAAVDAGRIPAPVHTDVGPDAPDEFSPSDEQPADDTYDTQLLLAMADARQDMAARESNAIITDVRRLRAERKLEEAAERVATGLQLFPWHSFVQAETGKLELERQRDARAVLGRLVVATSLEPESSWSWRLLANTLRAYGVTDEAELADNLATMVEFLPKVPWPPF